MSWKRIVLIGFGGLLLLSVALSFIRGGDDGTRTMDFSDMIAAARDGKVERLNVRADTLTMHLRNDSETYRVNISGDELDLARTLQDSGVMIGGTSPTAIRISRDSPTSYGTWIGLLISIVPLPIFVLVLYYALRNAVREGLKRANAAEADETTPSNRSGS